MERTLTLADSHVRLEPLAPDHSHELAAAAADGNLHQLWWTSVPAPNHTGEYIRQALTGPDAPTMLPFAVHRVATGRIVGSTRFYDFDESVPRVAIGYTWYGRSAQRTEVNAAAKRLLLQYAFGTMACETVELHTDFHNHASRRAIARLGARQDGILRSHQRRADGGLRDTVCFSILRSEWPDVKMGLDLRLQTQYQHDPG